MIEAETTGFDLRSPRSRPTFANISFIGRRAPNGLLFRGGTALPAWVALIAAAMGLVFAVHRHVREARRRGHRRAYLALLASVIAAPALVTLALFDSHSLHLHHYALGAMLMPLARYRFPLSGAVFGLAFGLLVEGIARWGMDPCWIPR